MRRPNLRKYLTASCGDAKAKNKRILQQHKGLCEKTKSKLQDNNDLAFFSARGKLIRKFEAFARCEHGEVLQLLLEILIFHNIVAF